VPTPAAVGVTAKPKVVLLAVSVPAIERMPFANDPTAEPAAIAVPSTRNVSGLAGVAGAGVAGAGVVGAVVDVAGGVVGVGETGVETLPPPPPHATAPAATRQITSALKLVRDSRPVFERSGILIGVPSGCFSAGLIARLPSIYALRETRP